MFAVGWGETDFLFLETMMVEFHCTYASFAYEEYLIYLRL